jgi:hypothetical protein
MDIRISAKHCFLYFFARNEAVHCYRRSAEGNAIIPPPLAQGSALYNTLYGMFESFTLCAFFAKHCFLYFLARN